jgi:WD40 repeat protein/DNA-binding SARP family transcriptional activator
MLQFHALGGLAITDDGEQVSIGGPRQRRLLAMLLIHRNAVVSVDRLADAVFAGEPTSAASTTLRSYVARIRKVVDGVGSGPSVVTQAPGYVLRLPGEAFDVACFERLVADAGARLARDDAVGASSVLREALGLWGGDAYAEFADEDWARPEAERLAELRLVAHERVVEAELACGRAAEVIPAIETLAGEHPLREGFRAQLMIALYRVGRQVDALRVFRDYREVLVEELGLEPSPALAELERRVLSHDPTLVLIEPAGFPLRGYRLGERLGRGRDGTVFAARLQGVERDFAVRVYREEVADSPEFVRSFEASAQRVASLHHPAVVPIDDYWREPGAAYLVMRRLPGGTLTDRLERGQLTAAALAALVGRIGGALVAAAEAGVVHGRVIADSVLFDAAGNAYLGDFTLGPPDATRTASDDVHDFAVLLRGCLGGDRGPVADVVARGVATVGRPPMAELVAMLVDALTGEPTAGEARPNPYKGLRAFEEADAADFFGRAGLVDEILARLAGDDVRGRLVLVVGGSGTGKSSVVRAGLLPRLRRGDVPGSRQWFITTMLPGSSPFKELAESLRRVAVAETTGLPDQLAADDGGIDRVLRRLVPGDSELLLVVDQFEELFTLASDQDRRAFLDGVIDAISAPDSRLRVVATLRGDFYDRPLAVQRFGSVVNDATVTIAAMSPSDLEAAIVEPAGRVGARVDRALVAELVSAVADEPAALPSLQFTLYELAERSPDGALTLAVYRELGGVDGAIAGRAEMLYTSLDDAERAAVRRMFERLVVVGAEGEPTRRRAPRTELSGVVADPTADDTVDRWAQARLLTLDRHPHTRVPTVELAHEALLREWPRLRDWIAEDREAIMVSGRLREAAAGWVELGRDPGALYRGARLDVALDVAHDRPDELPEPEREFLDASRTARDREQHQEAERIERQARANRRLRIQLAVIAVALAVALVGGLIALDQRRRSQDAADRAEVAAVQARDAETAQLAQRLGAQALVEEDLDLSLLLARQAVAIEDSPQTRGYLFETLQRSPEASAIMHGDGAALMTVAVSPDGATLAVGGESTTMHFYDLVTYEQIGEPLAVSRDLAASVAYSPDGRSFAVGSGRSVHLIDARTRELLARGPVDGSADRVAFTRDGSRLVVVVQPVAGGFLSGDPAQITILDATTLQAIGRSIEPGADYRGAYVAGSAASPHLALTPDDRFVITASDDGELAWWDLTSGEKTRTLEIETGPHALALSPDGLTVAVGIDRGIQLVDLGDGTVQTATGGPAGRPNWVVFSPDGETLASSNLDGTVTLWDVVSASSRKTLRGHRRSVQQPAFSPDGTTLYTVSHDGTAIAWDVTGERGLARPFTFTHDRFFDPYGDGHPGEFSPDGRLIAVGLKEQGVALWDAYELTPVGEPLLDTGGEVKTLAFAPDGRTLAAATGRGAVTLWDVASRSRLHEPLSAVPGGLVAGVGLGFSPDGATLTTAGDGGVQRWDVATGASLDLIKDTGAARHLAFNADGSVMATARPQGGAELWDVATGRSIAIVPGASGLDEFVALSPDGRIVAVGGFAEVVRLWDVRTRELVHALDLRGGGAYSLEFSPDGRTLAIGGFEPVASLWDVATGTQIGPRLTAGSRQTKLDISPDGHRLLMTHGNGQGAVWDIDPESWARRACTLANRTLTPEEWVEFLPGRHYEPAC